MEISVADAQDAIALLKADHRRVEDLFAKFEGARRADTKQRLAKQICTELTVHTILEEEIFYPASKGEIEDDLIREAYVEHNGAKLLIAEIEASGPDEELSDAKVKVLSEGSSITFTKKRSGRKGCLPRRGPPGSVDTACSRAKRSTGTDMQKNPWLFSVLTRGLWASKHRRSSRFAR